MRNKKIVNMLLDYGIGVILISLIVIFSILSNNFFTFNTVTTVLKQVSITGIIAVGMTFIILTGGIDLSVGSIAGVTSVTAAILMNNGFSIFQSSIIACTLSLVYGSISGIFITKLNMPPLIATLGVQTLLRGLAFIVTGGLPVFGFSKAYGNFAKATVWGIPLMVILFVAIFLIAKFVLERTVFGGYIYGVGGNEESSYLSGVNVTKIKIMAYMVSGLLAGVAGLVLLSRTNSGQPSAGGGYEMDAITSVVLGDVSLNGGKGNISKVIIGALVMGVLSTGMVMIGINDYVQQFIKGMALLAAVAYSQLSQKARTVTYK